MNCPNCDLVNPQSAQRCDCGYDFESGKIEKSYLAAQAAHRRVQPQQLIRELGKRNQRIGGMLFVIGVLSSFGSYAYARQHGGLYIVSAGAIVLGAVRFARGYDMERTGTLRSLWPKDY